MHGKPNSTPATESVVDNEPVSDFLRACRGLPISRTPAWLMRQSGSCLPVFQKLRERYSVVDIMLTPELAAQMTVEPLSTFGVDAAILFSDLLFPLAGMGLELDLDGAAGPNIRNPLRRTYDIDILATPPAEESLAQSFETIEVAKEQLTKIDKPLIGFGGAPFTLASYAIEGGVSRTFSRTKALMMGEPAAWKRLMTKLVTVQADYLSKQVMAGVDALQVFDTWAGVALGRDDYNRYVAPYNKALFQRLIRTGVPVIHFSSGTSAFIKEVAATGGDIISVDWHMPLDWYAQQIGANKPLQGNLDPVVLLAPWREIRYRLDELLRQAAGIQSYIFNLGQGLLPQTSPDTIKRVIDYLHNSPKDR